MADENNILDDDDFEKLLNDFINSDSDDNQAPDGEKTPDKKREAEKQAAEAIAEDYVSIPDIEDTYRPDFEETQSELAQAKQDYDEREAEPMLGTDESELAQAFVNYSVSINNLTKTRLQQEFLPKFKIEMLYPNYKPSIGLILSDDVVNGWLLLCKMFPQDVGTFPMKSTDEQFLNFAWRSFLCMFKILRYREKHVKKILYEEYLARKERQRKFVTEISKQDFPIDAELLVANYFRVAQKDVDGAFKSLTTNPAVFAPIDFKKLKPHFFGLIKVSPRDGIKMNIKIGNFLKNLRV